MNITPYSTTPGSSLKILISGAQKMTTRPIRIPVTTMDSMTAVRMPFSVRSRSRWPMFCPTKVVEAMEMDCMGNRINWSMR